MFKKLIHTILFISLASSLINSQEVTLSNEIIYRSDNGFALLGQVNDTILLFKDRNLRYSIDVFNKNLELLFEKELFFEKQKIHFNCLHAGDGYYSIIYSYETGFKLNTNAIKYNLRGIIIDSTQLFEEREVMDNENFSFLYSRDKKKILLYREIKYHTLQFILFDLEEHKSIWSRTKVFEDYNINQDLNGLLLTNEGMVVLAFEEYNHSFNRKKHFQDLILINPYTEEEKSVKINFKGKLSVSFNFDSDEANGDIVVAGLYAQKSSNRSEGYYLYKLNASGLSQAIDFFPFRRDLLLQQRGKRRKPKKYIPDLYVKEIIIRNDGGLVMLTEMQKEVARESVRRRYVDYHYEDVVLLALHPDGELFWDELIRKYQLSYDDDARFSSYFLFKTPSILKIIFNDEIKSENTISEYSVDPLGNGMRKSLFSTELHRLKLLFEDAIQVSSNSFLVPSMYNGKFRIIKLTY